LLLLHFTAHQLIPQLIPNVVADVISLIARFLQQPNSRSIKKNEISGNLVYKRRRRTHLGLNLAVVARWISFEFDSGTILGFLQEPII
jgi:hypothetical protein